MAEIKQFPTYNISPSEAIIICKYRLNDPSIALRSKLIAIERMANMETHNSVTKDELVGALRFLFKLYDFEGMV